MYTQPSDQSFDYQDLQEAPLVPRSQRFHPVLVGVGGALFGVLLAVILIRGSMPEMSPQQIVAMEGYQGKQPPIHIFNLESRAATNKLAGAVSEEHNANSNGQVVSANNASAGGGNTKAVSRGPVVQLASASAAELPLQSSTVEPAAVLLAIRTEEPEDNWPLEIVEVPASPILIGKDAQEVAAPMVEEFDYRKLNRKAQVSVAYASTKNTRRPVRQVSESAIKVLPVLTVISNTHVRAKPSQSSDIKMTLKAGASVTAFENAGAWLHVGANDGSSITGFVHESNVAITDID